MKLNTKALTLMALLATGVAGAQTTSDGTAAGTSINNTATATFTDPVTNQPATPVNSNTVTTTVLPKPGFDIVYRDGTDGTGTTGGNTAGSAQSTATLAPGGVLETPYYVMNNGNVGRLDTSATSAEPVANAYYIDLTTNTTGTTTSTAPTVQYYVDVDGDGQLSAAERAAGAVTRVEVPLDNPDTTADEGRIAIIQVLTNPTDAQPGQIAAATPVGTGQGFDTATNTVIPSVTETTDVLGLQFATITTITPGIVNDPNVPPTGTTTPPAGVPPITTVTPPGSTTPVPGYSVPPTDVPGTPGPVPIAINGDEQIAYPPADTNTDPDVVPFTNTVKNTGTQPDPVNLFPTDSTGNPVGTFDPTTGTFTNIPGLPAGTTVQFLDPTTKQPLPVGPDGYPTITVPAGGEGYYITKVTYPDSDSTPNPEPIPVLIGVDSGLDSGLTANDTTKDTIYPPAAQFGDATTELGTVPTPSPIESGTPGSTVYFPMDVTNQGEYPDSYAVSGTVQIPLTDGTTATVPVVYYADTNGNGVVDSGEAVVTNTGTVQPDSEVKLIAAVTIPTNAAATTVGQEPALQQTATGDYSTIVMQDTNDKINVTPAGNLAIAKFVQGGNGDATLNGLTAPTGYATGTSTALPGATINYAILAKNNYNVAIQNFALNDTTPANTTYSTATCTVTLSDGTAGPACSVTTTADTAGVVTAVRASTADGILPQGATMQLNMAVVVK